MSTGVPDKALPNTICCKNYSDFENYVLRALSGLNPFLGCYSMSGFYGIAKTKWVNVIKSNKEYCNTLRFLGERLQIEDHLFDLIESMVCQA